MKTQVPHWTLSNTILAWDTSFQPEEGGELGSSLSLLLILVEVGLDGVEEILTV